ncbi:prepilin-type N-terminal cleavage/methylation domain-containing protein [Paraneptunicella aestuarii]|uniref:type IV pilus modification PilV family protein n=1 Tax=Paraneptunicella aestuarii TaxID=2831148 RepID=UPI001E2A0F6F|nr:prepilin-type N-terminal cleavage/methylation domain-containing protein [Paraneptunicella aestuarii]UAA39652.1 prepilin-type N-terminal cleavage/methylation domain-containing protein [Paraneptunicella aestuarii]
MARMMSFTNGQKGFTLLEVLVASLLLFMAIALVSLAYQTGLKSELSAERKVFRSIVVTFIQQSIAEDLRLRPDTKSGEGRWGQLSFQWQVVKEYSKWSETGFDVESNSQVELGRELHLKNIEINVEGDVYEYTYLSWK